MKNLTSILLCLILFFSSSNLAAISECKTITTTGSTQTLSQTEDFGPLQIAILDLQDVINLISEGNKKTAVVILKSAIGQLRKIKELTPRMVKGMGARLKKAIKAVKSGDNSTAISEINHVISELQTL